MARILQPRRSLHEQLPLSKGDVAILSDGVALMSAGDYESLEFLLQQFLDDFHYCIMLSPLGKRACGSEVKRMALDVLLTCGFEVSEEEREQCFELQECDLANFLIIRMSPYLQDDILGVLMELQRSVEVVLRLRTALEAADWIAVEQMFHDADDTVVVCAILREVAVEAAREVGQLYCRQDSWAGDTAARLGRLQCASLHRTQSEVQLRSEFQATSSGGYPDGRGFRNDLPCLVRLGIVQSLFLKWQQLAVHAAVERSRRQHSEDAVADLGRKAFKGRQSACRRLSVWLRAPGCSTHYRVQQLRCTRLWRTWTEWRAVARQAKTKAEANEAARLLQQQQSQRSAFRRGAEPFALRLQGMASLARLQSLFGLWRKLAFYRQAADAIQAQTTASEAKKRGHLLAHKETMLSWFHTRLLRENVAMVLAAWTTWQREHWALRKASELEEASKQHRRLIAEAESGCVAHARLLVTRYMVRPAEEVLLSQVLGSWYGATKLWRLERHHDKQLSDSRSQLQNVEKLFRGLAWQLDEGVDGPSKAAPSSRGSAKRTPRLLRNSAGMSSPASTVSVVG
eukprot:TRINITY_DN72943_c0_g1_i2.p1 TRINITY_DN72943_c0_g1~~TRINITY_DN72943_c0_g1_i2.p1  ORF type:complete len:570 (+),score=95.79 TRINITY_DN72943_c0_g1_i2:171-1880(+)